MLLHKIIEKIHHTSIHHVTKEEFMAASSESTSITLQRNPVKLYIQDIFRALRTPENKYVYELFGLKFKNIMIHGSVTALYNTNATRTATNFELTDPTGCVNVYYDTTKNNSNIPTQTFKKLFQDFADVSRVGDENILTMSKLLDAIEKKKVKPLPFSEGDCVCVVGDIFVDDLMSVRMISAYECTLTSVERDIIWLEELRYMYEKFYLWKKE